MPRVTVKEAVQAAETFARELYDRAEIRHLRLEEVRLSDDSRDWEITLGWVEPAVERHSPLINPYVGLDIQKLPRVYKVFHVDGETGDVRSMTIRNVD